jgi:hypothetical protein
VDPKDQIPAVWPDFELTTMLSSLSEAEVDYVVIGGIAMVVHGSARVTRDLDIVFAPDPDNLERLGRVLIGLGARLRGVEDDVPFVPDAATLDGVDLLTLDTSAGWLDVHRRPTGAPPYKSLRKRAEVVEFGGHEILVATPADLQAMKRAAGRPVDQMDLEYLEAIIRIRRERGIR